MQVFRALLWAFFYKLAIKWPQLVTIADVRQYANLETFKVPCAPRYWQEISALTETIQEDTRTLYVVLHSSQANNAKEIEFPSIRLRRHNWASWVQYEPAAFGAVSNWFTLADQVATIAMASTDPRAKRLAQALSRMALEIGRISHVR